MFMTKAKFSLRFRIENESIIYEKIFVQIAIVLYSATIVCKYIVYYAKNFTFEFLSYFMQ